MSHQWQRSFDLSVPVARVWRALTDPDELRKVLGGPGDASADPAEPWSGMKVLEAEEGKLLRWRNERGDLPEACEFTVSFEETSTGSRITVTRCGFGEGETADVFSEANALGWEHGFMDLVLYLETGQLVKRHYHGTGRSRFGLMYRERDFGIEVRDVLAGGFGASAGLEPGDILVRLDGVPIYQRSDLWALYDVIEPGTRAEVEFVRDGALRRASGDVAGHEVWAVGE